jgi:MFS family permease
MATLGWTADRLGRRMFLVVVACVFGLGIAGLALAGSFWPLVLALVCSLRPPVSTTWGSTPRRWTWSRSTGRRFMSLLHAGFSGGAMVGAVGAGVLIQAGVDYRIVYWACWSRSRP